MHVGRLVKMSETILILIIILILTRQDETMFVPEMLAFLNAPM